MVHHSASQNKPLFEAGQTIVEVYIQKIKKIKYPYTHNKFQDRVVSSLSLT